MGVKANKAKGHRAEIEAAELIDQQFPIEYHMVRTGLDGGHDLTGKYAIGEVKAVKSGPEWLKSMLMQLDDPKKKHHFGFVRLSRGPGKPVRWLSVMDTSELVALLQQAAGKTGDTGE